MGQTEPVEVKLFRILGTAKAMAIPKLNATMLFRILGAAKEMANPKLKVLYLEIF